MRATPSTLLAAILLFGPTTPTWADDPVSEAEYYKRACGGGFSSTASLAQAAPGPDPEPGTAGTPGAPIPEAAGSPAGASDAHAKTLVAQMLAAHGGLARWQRARTFSFIHILTF